MVKKSVPFESCVEWTLWRMSTGLPSWVTADSVEGTDRTRLVNGIFFFNKKKKKKKKKKKEKNWKKIIKITWISFWNIFWISLWISCSRWRSDYPVEEALKGRKMKKVKQKGNKFSSSHLPCLQQSRPPPEERSKKEKVARWSSRMKKPFSFPLLSLF